MNGNTPLNIQPRGLLDFFGVKQGSWGPSHLVPTLQPQLELWRHYVAANALDIEGAITPVAGVVNVGRDFRGFTWVLPVGGVPPNPVPQTELWYLDQLTIQLTVTTGAGSEVNAVAPAIRVDGSGGGQLLVLPSTTSESLIADATIIRSTFVSMLYPCFVRPGAEIGLVFSGTVAATETLTALACTRLVRMRV